MSSMAHDILCSHTDASCNCPFLTAPFDVGCGPIVALPFPPPRRAGNEHRRAIAQLGGRPGHGHAHPARPPPPLSAAAITGIARPYLLPLLEGSTWLSRTASLGASRPRLDGPHLAADSPAAPRAARCHARAAQLRLRRRRRPPGWGPTGHRLCPPRQPAVSDHAALAAPREAGRFTPISAVDYYLRLARDAGLRYAANRRLRTGTTSASRRSRGRCRSGRASSCPIRSDVVLLNIGGAYGNAKHWPREHCDRIVAAAGRRIGPDRAHPLRSQRTSRRRSAGRSDADHPRVLSLADEDVRFGPTKAIIRRARLLVSTDSGPRHIAAAVGTPTITLLGPIDPRWSENYQAEAIQLHLPLECSPCGRRVCPLGHHRCMRDLTPEMVLQSGPSSNLSSTTVRRVA